MPAADFKIRQVEAFRALMHWRTVTRAAESLGITQPAASRLLADFEARVGFALFERRQGRLLPTAEAGVLYEEVERAFVGLERVAEVATQIRGQRRGVLRIAASEQFGPDWLPRVTAAFVRAHEGVDVTLLVRDAHEVAGLVAAQRCDLGFVAQALAHPTVRLTRLGRWPMRCIVPPGHRLAGKRVVTAADCANEPFISFPRGSDTRAPIDRVFVERGVTRRLGLEAEPAQAIVALVEAGAGIALVDALSVASAAGRVVVKRFTPMLPEALYIVRGTEQREGRLVQTFVQAVAAALAGLDERRPRGAKNAPEN